MAQVKVYGRRDRWSDRRREVSDAVQDCLVRAWRLPPDKRFHRFLLLDADDWVCPGRSDDYLILEIVCFSGRGDDAKRALIRALYERFAALGLARDDLELTIVESPPVNWGIRGVSADELTLSYPVVLP
ncbi:tautomerase family protein [Actinomadura flavalba]|uniref:tautomerase family protein n=1 Tax=Actinomadura flavalba TaxID=1120938 RepID=UPI00037CE3B3|nr:tautomerase family protein [Actinomadura flavalba]